MSIARRETSNSRRRRLLIYQNGREDVAETAAERRQFEKLREARRPSEIYGTSVNRRLRGRWFSLVPVRRRAMSGVAFVILGVAAIFCLGHWAAVAWQPLAFRPELARPLRLDRPDSFGAWVRAAFFAAAAGTSLLIYQLRRYRNDDFRGSYRIWPPVIVLMILASLDAVCQLVPWGGEIIEMMMGRRVALTGSDWIRIVLTVGGIALAMRMISEVRHSKLAIAMMSSAIIGFAIPMAARWGMIASDTPVRWLLITSAPMMASAALWVACGAYLRKLFREVRKMDAEDALSLRIEQWRVRVAEMRSASRRDKEQAAEAAKEAKAARTTTKTVVKKAEKAEKAEKTDTAATQPRPAVAAPNVSTARPPADKPDEESKEVRKSRFSLRFWRRGQQGDSGDGGLRDDVAQTRQSVQAAVNSAAAAVAVPVKAAAPVVAKPAVLPHQNQTIGTPTGGKTSDAAADGGEEPKVKKGGLFGWFGKKKDSAGDETGATSMRKTAVKPDAKPAATKSGAEDDDDAGDGDDPSIDWASMGKSERRRLRREMKRGGQAA